MDESEQLTSVLREHARQITPGPVSVGDLIARGRRRRTRHRAAISSAIALCAAIAIGLPLLVIVAVHRDRASVGPAVGPAVDQAAQLAHGHWSTLPAAPIAGRDGEVVTWTGSQMLIWGGAANNVGFNDGAAYDPATRVWQKLPAAPLSPRKNAISAWTGSQFFIWGGTFGAPVPCPLAGCSGFGDGALYNPKTLTWTKVSPSPIGGYRWAQALWVNGRVTVLSLPISEKPVTVINADAYDPATNKWTTLPALGVPADRPIMNVSAAAAGTNIIVWSEWQHQLGGGGLQSGTDSYIYNSVAHRWALAAIPESAGVGEPLSAGNEVVVPTSSFFCSGDCPPSSPRPGYFVTSTGHLGQTVSLDPMGLSGPTYLWAGDALVGLNTYDGQAAVWSAVTHAWTRLPTEPSQVPNSKGVAVWDGKSILTWEWVGPIAGNGKYPAYGQMFG